MRQLPHFGIPALGILGFVLLASCVPRPPQPLPGEPAVVDLGWYATARDGTVYAVMPERSSLEIRTGRAGALKHLGHNHIITTRALDGLVFLGRDRSRSRADLWVDVESFVVDDPAARAAAGAGFESEPSQADIDGTRANMTGPAVLDATHHPRIAASITPLDVPPGTASVTAALQLRGVVHRVPVSARWHVEGDSLVVEAELEVAQSSFGITPFAALGGALRIADELHIFVTVVAKPADAEAGARHPPASR